MEIRDEHYESLMRYFSMSTKSMEDHTVLIKNVFDDAREIAKLKQENLELKKELDYLKGLKK